MTAFGHTIFFDYKTPVEKESQLPVLNFKAYERDFRPYNHVIKYHQNQGRDVSLSTTHSFLENIDGQMWSFTVKDIVSFIWEKGSSSIYYDISQETDTTLLEYWFLHTLLPIYFTIEDKYEFIHAGGIEINSLPVLFIAPSYGGKSTLTDYFIQQGHSMISDDRVGLFEEESTIMAVSSYDYHRPYRRMEDLGVKVDSFMQEIKPLHAIYSLVPVEAKNDIHFTLLKGLEKFKALKYNFDFDLPLNKANSFELMAKIASHIPIYSVTIPWDKERLNEVYEKICTHAKG